MSSRMRSAPSSDDRRQKKKKKSKMSHSFSESLPFWNQPLSEALRVTVYNLYVVFFAWLYS